MTLFTIPIRTSYDIFTFYSSTNTKLAKEFITSHRNQLEKLGINNLPTSFPDWINDKNNLLVVARDCSTQKLIAGLRIVIWNKKSKLPVELSLDKINIDISQTLREYEYGKLAELSGIWVSGEHPGFGRILIRAGISVLKRKKIKSAISFASYHTKSMGDRLGFETNTDLGDNGTIFYPNENFKSYFMIQNDLKNMTGARAEEKDTITQLYSSPICEKLEPPRRKKYHINYNLSSYNDPDFTHEKIHTSGLKV